MIRRSVNYANYSLIRLRGWAILTALAIAGLIVGSFAVGADLIFIGVLGIAEFGTSVEKLSASAILLSIGVTLVVAAAAVVGMIWVADTCQRLMVRASDSDRLHARWGLRMTSLLATLTPFAFAAVVIALMALGFTFK